MILLCPYIHTHMMWQLSVLVCSSSRRQTKKRAVVVTVCISVMTLLSLFLAVLFLTWPTQVHLEMRFADV